MYDLSYVVPLVTNISFFLLVTPFLLFTHLVYKNHKKRNGSIFDYRIPVILTSLGSWAIGFFTAYYLAPLFPEGYSEKLITGSFPGCVLPVLGFEVSVLFNLMFFSVCVFKLKKRKDNGYVADTVKLAFLNAPYFFFILTAINLINIKK